MEILLRNGANINEKAVKNISVGETNDLKKEQGESREKEQRQRAEREKDREQRGKGGGR